MPIEIREVSPYLDEPRTYVLENVGDKEYLGIGKKGVIVRVETEPGLERSIGVFEFDAKELEVTKGGVKMTNAPFYTKPGDEVIVRGKGNSRHFEIRHTRP